jgi:hypothetical protein
MTDYIQLEDFVKSKDNKLVMIAGSRHHLSTNEDLQLNRKWYRKIFSGVLHFILHYICGITINVPFIQAVGHTMWLQTHDPRGFEDSI